MQFLKKQKQLPEFFSVYLKYKEYILFKPGTSVDALYFDLKTFFRYIKLNLHYTETLKNITKEEFKQIDISDVTLEDLNMVTTNIIIDFIYFCSNVLKNEVEARNRKLTSIKSFFTYLENNNLISVNRAYGMQSARTGKRLPQYLNLTESKKLLAKTINSDMIYKIRNYAMTCIFLNCGLRLSELTGIDIDNIKLDEKTMKICGKGNKERIIYLDEACIEAITEYLKVRPKIGKDNIDYYALFLSSRRKRISKRNVQEIIKNELKMVFEDDSEGYHTHTLRHSSASLLYNESDIDILIIKEILGHSSIAATEIYTHIDSGKLKEIMQNCAISSIIEKKNKEELLNGSK